MHVFKAIASAPDASAHPHVTRWYKHIQSYASEHASLSGSSTAGEAFIGGETAAAAAQKDEEEEEEVDLFGEDDEEDAEAERIKAERVAAYEAKKASKGPKPAAKVSTECPLFLFPLRSRISRTFPKIPPCLCTLLVNMMLTNGCCYVSV